MAIVIDIQAKGLSTANTGISKFEKSLERIMDLVDKLDSRMGRIGTGLSQVAGAIQHSARGGRGGSQKPPQVSMTPMDMYRWFDAQNRASGGRFQAQRKQALMNAWQFYGDQFASGNLGAMKHISQLAGPVGGLARGGVGNKLMQAVLTSRIGLGGAGGASVMPLVGRMVGVAAGAGPAGLAIAGVVAALGAVAAVAWRASSGLASLGAMAYRTGAPLSQAGRAQALSMAGIDSEAAYQASMSSGVARGLMSGRGVSLMGGVFGNQNRTDYGLEVFKMIAGAKSESDAQRIARAFGQDDGMKAFYLRKDQKAFIAGGGLRQDAGAMQLGIQAEFDKERLGKRWESLVMKVQAKLLPIVERVLAGLETFFAWLDKIMRKLGFGGEGAGSVNPVEKNTRAIDENTRALKEYREVIGGGGRAARAIPRGLEGHRLSDPSFREAVSSGLV